MRAIDVLLLATVVAIGGCATRVTRNSPPPPAPESAPDDRLDATLWAQTSVERDLVYREVYRQAGAAMLRALADPSIDALPNGERSGSANGLPPAVIADVDETVLDNSPYEARMIRDGASFDPATWLVWVSEASAIPVPGALDFVRLAASHGVKMFYISNRDQSLDPYTRENLVRAGFPMAANEAEMLNAGMATPGCTAKGADKGCRRRIVAQHYRVLLELGDQLGDFLDVAGLSPEGRHEAVEPYLGWVGERWFAFPNPTYGHWESIIAGPASAGKDEQNRRKRAALRYDFGSER